jgi:hypothetical protein
MAMVDWMAIAGACGLTAAIGVGLVLWEHYEDQRLARSRRRREDRDPAPVRVPSRHRLDVRRLDARRRRAA